MRLAKLRNHPIVRRLIALADRHRLITALVVVVVVAVALVSVSVNLYYGGGFYRYDLSRPGYEHERQEITKPEPAKTYDTTSPVTRATVDEFLQEYDAHLSDLKRYGNFRDTSLSDEDLQIIPEKN